MNIKLLTILMTLLLGVGALSVSEPVKHSGGTWHEKRKGGGAGAARGGAGGGGGSVGASPAVFRGGTYNGGAPAAYRSGGRSPAGIAPFFLGGLAAGAFLGYGFYGYGNQGINLYNASNGRPISYTNGTTGSQTSLPVLCACAANLNCGCDSVSDGSAIESLPTAATRTLDVQGRSYLLINGTIDPALDASQSAASVLRGWSLPILLPLSLVALYLF